MKDKTVFPNVYSCYGQEILHMQQLSENSILHPVLQL